MKLLLVDWIDSGGYTRWTSFKEIRETSVKSIRSVGWLLHETVDCVWILSHRDDRDPEFVAMGKGDLSIPRGAIISIRELNEEASVPYDGSLSVLP